MNMRIAVLPGDGIGPEIMAEGCKVLQRVADLFGHEVTLEQAFVGWTAIDEAGEAFPDATRDVCDRADAVYFGCVGNPERDMTVPQQERPERCAVLTLREGNYANLRPAICYRALAPQSVVKPEIIGDGVNVLIVRELTGGLYYGQPRGITRDGDTARGVDSLVYTTEEIVRVSRVAFEAAQERGKKLCSVDKVNMLASSQLWREVVSGLAAEYPDVELTHMLADRAAMELIRRPHQFDVIVTGNLFGDILSDEAAVLAGSLGMLPSAAIGDGKPMVEPIHGSAPDIAGQGIANPIATILSGAMMLRHAFDLDAEAESIERAVEAALDDGCRTPDIAAPGTTRVNTQEMGSAIAERIKPVGG